MNRVEFTFSRGQKRMLSTRDAQILQKLGHGTYETRDMANMPVVQKVAPVGPAAPEAPANDDGLDAMDKEQLHALAKERGLRLHFNLGADKVREALRAAV